MVLAPNKSLGQHWLHDETSLEAMCDAASIGDGDHVLEIGPGLGTLTSRLLSRAADVTAVEFDSQLAESLREHIGTTAPLDRLHIVEADILQFDLRTMPINYKICANIPYYLTSQLIRVLGESARPPERAALLVQKEVAQRVCAAPGDMSILAVTTQYFFEVSCGLVVPAKLFTPPPKVDSQILILIRRSNPPFDIDVKRFFRLVKFGFAGKRKMLTNTLSAGLCLTKGDVAEVLKSSGIIETARPQELSLEQWKTIYDRLQTYLTT
jgi:16S rRNA (adenine1518-N6/adenine1519-N6)-dimethyltransferase